MDIRKLLTSLASGLTASALMLSAFAGLPAAVTSYAASGVIVDTTEEYQVIRGFGGMNHPEWQSYNAQYGATGDMTAEQVQTAFGNGDNELGLTILRIFVSDDQNAWKNAIPTAQRAQALGATVFATPWNPPASMRKDGSGGPTGGKYILDKSKQAEYAQHLNSFIKYCSSQGVELNSISVQNEPDWSGEWTYWSPDECASFLANYGKAVTSGTNTKMMSPESFSYGKSYYNAILNNPQAMANCDMFGTHFYGTARNNMDFPALENSGKEIWMTEVYVPNSDENSADRWPEGVQVAENIHNALVVGNMNAYVWWYIRRQYGFMWDNGKVSKRGYAMAQFSKWVRPGDIRIGCTESPESNILCSAYKNDNGQVAIVAINKGSTEINQVFTLGSGEKITNIDRYRTSGSENIALTADMAYSGSGFNAQLPANSVSTFVVTLEGGGQPYVPAVDGDGYYYHDRFEADTCSWTGRGAATVMTSGRTAYDGGESLLVQDRTSAWNGAMKSLNKKTFVPGSSYSFSANVMYYDGGAADTFYMKLQYTGSDGEAHYSEIAAAEAVKGEWVQLANISYKIPEDAADAQIYIETADSTSNFYIDEAIGAPEGTVIRGAEPTSFIPGDVNCDGVVDSFDMIPARKGLTGGFADTSARLAFDVDQDGQQTIADLVLLQKYLLGQIKTFPKSGSSGSGNNENNENNENNGNNTNDMLTMTPYTARVNQNFKEYEPEDARQEKAGVQYGTVKSGTYYSTTCNRTKPYNILLPANYDSSRQYPVLYVMHGYWENQNRMITEGNGTMYTRQIIGNAIAEGAAKDMIVVFPYIYSSAVQENCTAMDDANNAAYDNFENDLLKDLMPHIESTYSVKTDRENTAITGFSMGGRESLLIGMKHADIFGYVGAICPAPGVTGSFKWNSEEESPMLLFITAGSNDTVVYDNPKNYHDNFTANGVPHVWHYVNGGYHGDNSIHAHIYNFVRNIFHAEDWA